MKSGELILEYGKFLRAFVVVGVLWFPVVFLTAAAIESGGFQDMEATESSETWPGFLLVFAVYSAFVMPGAIEAWGVGHGITRKGIRKGSPWSRDFYAGWEDVESITFNASGQYLVIRTSKGIIRVSTWLHGLGDLAIAIIGNVPKDKWEPTRDLILGLKPEDSVPVGDG